MAWYYIKMPQAAKDMIYKRLSDVSSYVFKAAGREEINRDGLNRIGRILAAATDATENIYFNDSIGNVGLIPSENFISTELVFESTSIKEAAELGYGGYTVGYPPVLVLDPANKYSEIDETYVDSSDNDKFASIPVEIPATISEVTEQMISWNLDAPYKSITPKSRSIPVYNMSGAFYIAYPTSGLATGQYISEMKALANPILKTTYQGTDYIINLCALFGIQSNRFEGAYGSYFTDEHNYKLRYYIGAEYSDLKPGAKAGEKFNEILDPIYTPGQLFIGAYKNSSGSQSTDYGWFLCENRDIDQLLNSIFNITYDNPRTFVTGNYAPPPNINPATGTLPSGGGGSSGSSDSPYTSGGTTQPTVPSQPGGSPGSWELGGDKIDTIPSTLQTLDTGLFRTYSMTLEQVQHFGEAIWDAGVLESIIKHYDNPTDLILSLTEIPVTPAHGEDEEITFKWIPEWLNVLDVTGAPVTNQYIQVDFGTINVKRYSGTFYDFQPYTTAHLYLPYVGFVPIKASEIMGGTIQVTYTIDAVYGVGICNVISSTYGCIGTYNCSVGRQLPLQSREATDLYVTLLKSGIVLASAGVSAAAGAGASAAGKAANTALDKGLASEAFWQDKVPDISNTMQDFYLDQAVRHENTAANLNNIAARALPAGQTAVGIVGAVDNALSAVESANANIQRSGSFDSFVGRLSSQRAYLILSIPRQNYPGNYYDQTIGFPSNIQGNLGSFYGYLECRSVSVMAKGATGAELEEMKNILSGGIVIANTSDGTYYPI